MSETTANFCSVCGANLRTNDPFSSSKPIQVQHSEPKSRKKRSVIVMIVVIIAVLLASDTIDSLISTNFNSYPKYGLESISGSVCYSFSKTENSNRSQSSSSLSLAPNYLEQVFLDFNQGLGSLLEYNVSAIEQGQGSLGNGPMVILNGLTDNNYWYQVGLSWNSLNASGTGIRLAGFGLIFEVFNASSGKSVFPYTYPHSIELNFSAPVRQGDIVLLSLKILNENTSNGKYGMVVASGYDWETRASANISYLSYAANRFVSAPFSNYPSGLMTSWYVSSPSFCSLQKVTYSNTIIPLQSVEVCIDEVELPTFSALYSGCSGLVSFSSYLGTKYQSYSLSGHRVYVTPYEFVTS